MKRGKQEEASAPSRMAALRRAAAACESTTRGRERGGRLPSEGAIGSVG